MQLPALSIIESWPKPNYVNPETKGPANLIVTFIFFPLVLVIIAIRIYTRSRISRNFGADDWFIVVTLLPTTAFAVLSLVAELHYGWNRHVWDVPLNQIITGLKLAMSTTILFCAATTLTKLSMLTLIYRVISDGSTKYGRVIIASMSLVAVQGVAFCLSVLFQCRIPARYWTLSFQPQPQCISETKNLLAAGIVNSATDLLVVLLPMPMVSRLKLPYQQQAIVVLLFSAGLLVTLAGGVRTYYLYRVTSDWDKTWKAYPVWLSSAVELYVGIICASIPATKKFFSRFNPRFFGSSLFLFTHSSRNNTSRFSQPLDRQIADVEMYPIQTSSQAGSTPGLEQKGFGRTDRERGERGERGFDGEVKFGKGDLSEGTLVDGGSNSGSGNETGNFGRPSTMGSMKSGNTIVVGRYTGDEGVGGSTDDLVARNNKSEKEHEVLG